MIYSVASFPYTAFRRIKCQPRPRGNQGTAKRFMYKECICAFDIETSRIKEIEQAIMYVWQFAMRFEGETYIAMGRTWEEYKEFVQNLQNNMHEWERICIFVHNLSYEFQWLQGIFPMTEENVFAVDRRKVLKCQIGPMEYRCSYLHSNMSLAQYTRKMGIEHEKLEGALDYSIVRYPHTPLTDTEKAYCIHDVLGLVEAIEKEMNMDGDSLYTFPLTSTGYVRRECKRAMKKYNHVQLYEMKPDLHIWQLCREAFRGGNTHANRFYAGQILENVTSYDRSSSYPDVICNCMFPMGAFEPQQANLAALMRLMGKRGRACLARLRLFNVALRDEMWGFPYLTVDKSRNKHEYEADNGRILSADVLEITATDVDLRIILQEYNADIEVLELWTAPYKKLPKPIIDLNIELYTDKTSLKGIPEQEVYYGKRKAMLNSVYGMMAQNPVKRSYLWGADWALDTSKSDEELLARYNKNSFLCYQWGVWVTAWARYRLEEGLRLAGAGAVYTDTDSVKYIGEVDWTKYNKERIRESKANGAFAKDIKGVIHYMGVYEHDASYEKFSTLGAKKYAYEENGGLHITIAGVNKKEGAHELGSIDNFKEGFIFSKAGGTESVYNDRPETDSITVDGHIYSIPPNIVIRDSTYTLGITSEYSEILNKSKYLMEQMQNTY